VQFNRALPSARQFDTQDETLLKDGKSAVLVAVGLKDVELAAAVPVPVPVAKVLLDDDDDVDVDDVGSENVEGGTKEGEGSAVPCEHTITVKSWRMRNKGMGGYRFIVGFICKRVRSQ